MEVIIWLKDIVQNIRTEYHIYFYVLFVCYAILTHTFRMHKTNVEKVVNTGK